MRATARGRDLGVRLRDVRRKREMTQLELSRLIGAHVTTVRRWERGVSLPEEWWHDPLRRVLGLPAWNRVSIPSDRGDIG